MIPIAQYQRTHRGAALPLRALRQHLEQHGIPGPHQIGELAMALAMPPSAIRAAISFYPDLQHHEPRIRVCRGTACHLEGGAELAEALSHTADIEEVHCLGYCDRSPVAMERDGEIFGWSCRQMGGPPLLRCMADEPIVLARAMRGDCAELSRARDEGAYAVLERVLEARNSILHEVEVSRLRGRGGAGFPVARKWASCAATESPRRYVIANGDEGDPGSFVDRVLMEQDPHALIEGMLLCALAIGATEGIVFIRSEYPGAIAAMSRAVDEAWSANLLGNMILGSDFCFDITVFAGMGSYVCGEETALLNALEGRRGEVRLRPPYPAQAGYHGYPTVINNVETLATVPWIVERGGEGFASIGTGASTGTMAMCLSAGFARPGIVEVPFGVTLREVIEEAGGGRNGKPLDAVFMGGPMGSIVRPSAWDAPVCYEAMRARGLQLGHGGLVAIEQGTDYRALLMHLLEFMTAESCGKCAPCRLGSGALLEMHKSQGPGKEMLGLLDVIRQTSLCSFGELMTGPMKHIVERLETNS